jgi:hypothetical protein
MQKFLDSEVCAARGCYVQPDGVLHKQEQKVVDSMMVADLIDGSLAEESMLGVVSRDDDVWPGLYMASRTAKSVVHISTSVSPRVPKYYEALPSPPYKRINWS